jgi:hypothetical protein
MTSDVGSSHLLEFAFWALWVTAVLRNIPSKDPKIVGSVLLLIGSYLTLRSNTQLSSVLYLTLGHF